MAGSITSVDARNESLPNSDIADHEEDSTVIADQVVNCQWNGTEFQDGDQVCAQGTAYECNYGKWLKLSEDC